MRLQPTSAGRVPLDMASHLAIMVTRFVGWGHQRWGRSVVIGEMAAGRSRWILSLGHRLTPARDLVAAFTAPPSQPFPLGPLGRVLEGGAPQQVRWPRCRPGVPHTVQPAFPASANVSSQAKCRKPAWPVLARPSRPRGLSSAARPFHSRRMASHPAARRGGRGDTGASSVGPGPATVSPLGVDSSRPPPSPDRVSTTLLRHPLPTLAPALGPCAPGPGVGTWGAP